MTEVIDIKLLRQDPDAVRELCQKREAGIDVEQLLAIDEEMRKTKTTRQELQKERKTLQGPNVREEAIALRDKIAQLEQQVRKLQDEHHALWSQLPNLLAPDTPPGQSEADNVELKRWGNVPSFDFQPRTHDELGAQLDVLDLERGAKVSGTGFYYWKGAGARLNWGLFSLATDFLLEKGFTPMFTPVAAKDHTLFGTGYLPFSADQIYRLENEDISLIGTSEQTLVGYHGDEILDPDSLPLLYTAFTPCFRTEAGSYGRAARGAFRVHQFHKVEQIVFCHPDESEKWHQLCLDYEEEFMQLLNIPYRVVRVCLGDLGPPAYKKYDVEGYFAGFGEYRETHSNTNLLDYQTRRLGIRCKEGKKTFHPHTISATMITDRAALALLENNQQQDGSVRVPEALRPYMGGRDIIR